MCLKRVELPRHVPEKAQAEKPFPRREPAEFDATGYYAVRT